MLSLLTDAVATRVAAHCGIDAAVGRPLFAPPKGVAADIALPCFQLAKAKGVPPPALAAELAAAFAGSGIEAVATGPFLNPTFRPAALARPLIGVLTADPRAALRSVVGGKRTACIDFSSPNIAK